MRWSPLVCLILIAGWTLPVQAQGPAESASHAMINDALRQIDGRFTRDSENYVITYDNRTFVLSRLSNGARLLAKGTIKAQPSLQTLNRYNQEVAVTTRAVHHPKMGVVLEMGMDCTLGVSEANLKKFVARFAQDIGEFEAFLAKQPKETAGKSDPPVGVKTEKQKPPIKITPKSDDKEFVITFPTSEPEKWETAWKVQWDMVTGKQANDEGFSRVVNGKAQPGFPGRGSPLLFRIKKAFYKPGQTAPWIQVLEDAQPQEFYVPYYFRSTRFFDLRDVGSYTSLGAKEGGAVSQLLSSAKNVMAELRDTGVAYKYGDRTRRGEELTLWANFQAGNYTYMVEYGFKDDGGIVFRHSPTGYNYMASFDGHHMHGSYWRLGIKLGPEGNNDKNQAYVMRLPIDPKDQGDKGKLDFQAVTRESFHDWSAEEFTRIRVTNPHYSVVPATKERPALPISYDLVTVQQGVARHRRNADETFTLHDFWITRHDCPEKMYHNLGEYFMQKGQLNPKLLDMEGQNVTLWTSSSALHVPRAEDGIIAGNSPNNGQALIYWTSFELRPRNLFLRTPIYR